MMPESYSIIKEFLEEIKAGNIFSSDLGLCSNFKCFCMLHTALFYYEIDDLRKIFRKMLCNFPKYTGDPVYPLVPQDEYNAHSTYRVDFYDPDTPYGAIRLEFVDWALKEITQNRVSYMKS